MTDNNQALREKLAAIEHERWADWQRWMHTKGRYDVFSGEEVYVFPKAYIEHLTHQIDTPYTELTNKEKASDMEEVDRYWPLIVEATAEAYLLGWNHKPLQQPAETEKT